VFCNTKVDCAEVARHLQSENIVALALHGDLDQAQRNQVLVRFSNRSASVLVATDVAARGLDVKDIDAVFNYELPQQPEVYVHRIGRTGRAGKTGISVSLVEEREMWRLQEIEKLLPDSLIQERGIPDARRGDETLVPSMTTIQISGGRKNKLRPGDLLGVLTAQGGIPGNAVGKIDLFDNVGYVAVQNKHVSKALRQLSDRPIKGRKYRARARTH
jgi:ATP-independent RNA helicase DbpA